MTQRHLHQVRTNRFGFKFLLSAFALIIAIGFTGLPAAASSRDNFTSIAAAPEGGFWIHKDNGTTIAVDGAPQYESVSKPGSIVAVPGKTNAGYWIVTTDGEIHSRGGAPTICEGNFKNCSGFRDTDNTYISAVAAAPDGKGLWAVDNFRHLWTAGTARSFGDVTSDKATPTGIVGSPSGNGYYIVMRDGGVHVRGDAVFHGSTGGNPPGGKDVTGIALYQNAKGEVSGYWLVAEDGGVHTFGEAPFLGSSPSNDNPAATNIVTRPDGSYSWVYSNGHYQHGDSLTVPAIRSNVWGTVWEAHTSGGRGIPITLSPANGNKHQAWRMMPTGTDKSIVQIVNVATGLCAEVPQGIGPDVVQFPCKGKNEGWDIQRFKVVNDPNGRMLMSVQPARHAIGGVSTNAVISLLPYHGDSNIYTIWKMQ